MSENFKKTSKLKNIPTTVGANSTYKEIYVPPAKSPAELAAPKMLEVLRKLRSDLVVDGMKAGAYHKQIIEAAIAEAEGRKA